MISSYQTARFAAPSLLALVLGGCSGDVTEEKLRQWVDGSVTLDGQPLASGTIQFLAVDKGDGVPVTGVITDGRFSIPRSQGPLPGDYRVMISSQGGAPAPVPSEGRMRAPGSDSPNSGMGLRERTAKGLREARANEIIPEKYNAKTTLKAVVKVAESNTFDFPLVK